MHFLNCEESLLTFPGYNTDIKFKTSVYINTLLFSHAFGLIIITNTSILSNAVLELDTFYTKRSPQWHNVNALITPTLFWPVIVEFALLILQCLVMYEKLSTASAAGWLGCNSQATQEL